MPEAATPTGTAPARKRGRETVRDMLLSLAVCVAVIVPVWFLGQPAPSDSKALRVVDTAADLSAFRAAAPGVPAPGPLPKGWRPTSSTLAGGQLRIGYVTPDDGYVEYAGQGGSQAQRGGSVEAFLREQTGRGTAGTTLAVGDRRFTLYSDGDGHTSLVDARPAGTVVVGGLRETAEDDELAELAGALQ